METMDRKFNTSFQPNLGETVPEGGLFDKTFFIVSAVSEGVESSSVGFLSVDGCCGAVI